MTQETTLHVLRDCMWAKDFSFKLRGTDCDESFFGSTLEEWVITNVLDPAISHLSLLSFVLGCWIVWCSRNKEVIEGTFLPSVAQMQWHRKLMGECCLAFGSMNDLNPQRVLRWISWVKPPDNDLPSKEPKRGLEALRSVFSCN